MRVRAILLTVAVVLVFWATVLPASGQNGAIVTRDDAFFGFYVVDPATQLLSFHTTNWNVCSTPPDRHPVFHQEILLPHDGVLLVQERGPMFTKVYWPATAEDFLADPCAFILGGPLVAEGIAELKYTDNDSLVSLTRTNSWGESLSGVLFDVAEWCGDSGFVRFRWGYRARIDKKGEFYLMNQHGPELICKGD